MFRGLLYRSLLPLILLNTLITTHPQPAAYLTHILLCHTHADRWKTRFMSTLWSWSALRLDCPTRDLARYSDAHTPLGSQAISRMDPRLHPAWIPGCIPLGSRAASRMDPGLHPAWIPGCIPHGSQAASRMDPGLHPAWIPGCIPLGSQAARARPGYILLSSYQG